VIVWEKGGKIPGVISPKRSLPVSEDQKEERELGSTLAQGMSALRGREDSMLLCCGDERERGFFDSPKKKKAWQHHPDGDGKPRGKG